MTASLAIVLAYLVLMVVIGIIVRRRAAASSVQYLLADRSLGRVLLFITMASTNFSAYTVFGLSGAGYRIGYAYYPIMSFGTGFMALGLFVIGRRIVALSRERGYVTPTDFIADRYGSPLLRKMFSAVLILFTLPYIAIQAISSGRSLESLVGIPYAAGAALVTGCIVIYVVLGGMRSIAWTDVVQSVMILAFAAAGFALIAQRSGGFVRVNEEVRTAFPALYSRPGQDGSMSPGAWFGFLFLWFFADPMFPQLFQKLIASRDQRALKTTVVLYPVITTVLFFLTVSIGVMGRHAFPALSAAQSESVYPMLLARYASPVLATILLTGGLAALMSTMDSQLLTVGSLVTGDFFPARARGVWVQRAVVLGVGIAGMLLALRPPRTILDFINRSSFTGLAVLAPTVLGGLYWTRANRQGAAASIVAGETLVALFYFDVIRIPGIQPVVPAVAAAAAVFVAVSLLFPSAAGKPELVERVPRRVAWKAVPFVVLFILANDFWAWGRAPIILLGIPLWTWYSFVLGFALAAAYGVFLRPQAAEMRDVSGGQPRSWRGSSRAGRPR